MDQTTLYCIIIYHMYIQTIDLQVFLDSFSYRFLGFPLPLAMTILGLMYSPFYRIHGSPTIYSFIFSTTCATPTLSNTITFNPITQYFRTSCVAFSSLLHLIYSRIGILPHNNMSHTTLLVLQLYNDHNNQYKTSIFVNKHYSFLVCVCIYYIHPWIMQNKQEVSAKSLTLRDDQSHIQSRSPRYQVYSHESGLGKTLFVC